MRPSLHVEPEGFAATARHYIRDLIYGANDGVITTFAVVAGVTGGALSARAVLIVGVANLLADGLSMGVGNYLSIRSHESALAAENLLSTVLRLKLELTLSLAEKKELDEILSALKGTEAVSGRAGALLYDASGVAVEPGQICVDGLPESVRATVARLTAEAKAPDQARADEAKRALVILHRVLHEVS